MSDLLPPPPPRRPAPNQLRQRIELELATAQHPRRPWIAPVVAVVAAAAVLVAAVLGVSAYRHSSIAEPATTVSPRPTPTAPAVPPPTATSTAPTSPNTPPSATDGQGGRELAGRQLSTAEISDLRRTCAADQDADQRPPSTATVVSARFEHWAGPKGPSRSSSRVLVLRAGGQAWVCTDDASDGPLTVGGDRPDRSVPVVEVDDFGATSGTCSHRDDDSLTSPAMFEVDDAVAGGRIRVNVGNTKGVWQSVTPRAGFLYVSVGLFGRDAWISSPWIEYEFLDRAGRALAVQPYGERGTPTTRRMSATVRTCADMTRDVGTTETFTPPSSVAAGVNACVKLAAEASATSEVGRPSGWKAEVVRAGTGSWAAVLVHGRSRFGCSLAPTREVSAVIPDSPSTAASSFWFAANPIAATDGASFWAAGRVPADVTAIRYVLPGGVEVPATIGSDGHWMATYHVDGRDLDTEDNTADWEPVHVTVTRKGAAPIRYSIPFTEKTMCNQVSHGC